MNQPTPTTEFATVSEQQSAQPSNQQKKQITRDKILNVLLAVVLVVLITTVVVKAFFVTSVVVSGDSMLPTYPSGTVVKVNRRANADTVERGDIVVFYLNTPNWFRRHFDLFPKGDDANYEYRLLIKRVVATQGEQIWVEQAGNKYKVMVKTTDGQIVSELYAVVGESVENEAFIAEDTFYISPSMLKRLASYTKAAPYTVPQGYFFAMGDNRDVSHDSRFDDIGDIPYTNLFGEVVQ